MCRFTLYLGPPIALSSLITEPTHSLIHQSFESLEREEPLNGDGFGVGWYAPEMSDRPAVFRSVSPAWSNRNLLELCRVTRSPCVLAHVRAATRGLSVTETNCHPFAQGRLTMMHNGEVGGFARMRRGIIAGLSDRAFEAVQGTTDSEHLFGVFLDEHGASGVESSGGGASGVESSTGDTLAGALHRALVRVSALGRALGLDEPSYLNVAVSDGRHAAVSRCTTDALGRADSLYVHTGRRYVCESGVCRMIEPSGGAGPAVIVSSEPLSADPGWTAVPVNHMVVVDANRSVSIRPCPLP